MLGNFSYCNPAKLYFGDQSLDYLNTELPKYGKNVVLIYGGGSIKKNGIYDDVIKILEAQGKNVAEIAGVMPNPTLAKLYEGIEIARKHQADLLLAVGGGSVCDYAKAVSVSVNCEEDPWEKYFVRFEEPSCETLPVDGRDWLGDECRLCHHQSGDKAENRSRLCRREDHPALCHPESAVHDDTAASPDGSRHLRYLQSHLRAVFLR